MGETAQIQLIIYTSRLLLFICQQCLFIILHHCPLLWAGLDRTPQSCYYVTLLCGGLDRTPLSGPVQRVGEWTEVSGQVQRVRQWTVDWTLSYVVDWTGHTFTIRGGSTPLSTLQRTGLDRKHVHNQERGAWGTCSMFMWLWPHWPVSSDHTHYESVSSDHDYFYTIYGLNSSFHIHDIERNIIW